MKITSGSSQPFAGATQIMNAAADSVQNDPQAAMLKVDQAKKATEVGVKLQKATNQMLGSILDIKA